MTMDGERESAVGRLLREHGVGSGPDARIGMREAERQTGVSRQTLAAWMRAVDPARPTRHTNKNLDLVARGLGIDRRRLGMASMIDNGLAIESGDEDELLAALVALRQQARELEENVTQIILLHTQRKRVNADGT